MKTIRVILVITISSLLAVNIYLSAHNKGFDEGYVAGGISVYLGLENLNTLLEKDKK